MNLKSQEQIDLIKVLNEDRIKQFDDLILKFHSPPGYDASYNLNLRDSIHLIL